MTLVDIISNGGLLCDGDWIEKKDQDVRGKVRLIQLADIGDGEFKDKSSKYITLETAERLHCTFLEKGDILIARLPEPLGRACIFPLEGAYITAVDIAILRIKDISINPQYIMYLINSSTFRSQIKQYESGTTRKRISRKNLEKIEFSLPNLEIQNRIVARIEELFSKLDKAVDTLKTTKEQLAVYRQAVLKNAFSNIAEYIPFGKITSSRLGKMLDKQKNVDVPCKYLRNINVRWFSFDLSDLLDMKIEEKEFEKYTLCKNDLVICEGGEPGRCAVWEKDETIFYQKALHRVRFTIKAEPRFYMYYLWYITQSGLINRFYTGTGIKHLTGQSLEKIPVPVTDIGEQKRLLELIEMRLSVCDNIEKTVDAALAQADAMRQSILKQAFEGKI